MTDSSNTMREARDAQYRSWSIRENLLDLGNRIDETLQSAYRRSAYMAGHNQLKVLRAFQEARVSEAGFGGTTGYGYDDLGRDQLETVYAAAFGAEAALVRMQISSGTHALAAGLFGVLRPGDRFISLTGDVYDTLHDVIGAEDDESDTGSLCDYGVAYETIPLKDGRADLDRIKERLGDAADVKLCFIQRSRGYSSRPALTISDIETVIEAVRSVRPEMIIMVDNCYGEFMEEKEPTEVGADLIAGSLIKNPGGGIAPTGGYLAGRRELVEKAAARLTAPGIGSEVGPTLGQTRLLAQGFYFAPHTVMETVKGLDFAAALMAELGVETTPGAGTVRSDIIQVLRFNGEAEMVAFVQSIQAAAPVDSFVTPVPAPMPGYRSSVIMAAGAFIQGSSLELSADGPVAPPWQAYLQGGLVYDQVRLAALLAAERMLQTQERSV